MASKLDNGGCEGLDIAAAALGTEGLEADLEFSRVSGAGMELGGKSSSEKSNGPGTAGRSSAEGMGAGAADIGCSFLLLLDDEEVEEGRSAAVGPGFPPIKEGCKSESRN